MSLGVRSSSTSISSSKIAEFSNPDCFDGFLVPIKNWMMIVNTFIILNLIEVKTDVDKKEYQK
jgi:hypothetical protein